MKLHLANFAHQNIFTGYGEGYVLINQIRYEKSLIVLPDHLVKDWPILSVHELELQHFESLLPHSPEIILLGTGADHKFPGHNLLSQLAKMGIGIEIMDTKACCRTYNILVEEGRRVAAAVLI
ncbi:MAG: Xcc1710-like domain-containing protein [Gammaproteobacteria bacterium]|nr:Mth938-like domain-containing protein [Pseudomonadota bacterium]QOJ19356.1 MAG: Xcc1710-like domain-containing protein [Gammaproteobacteria bacterium]